MNATKGHVLHIPRWYPGLNGPQGGIFIYKHIMSISNYSHSIINVNTSKGKDIPLKMVLTAKSGNMITYSYFYHSKNKFQNVFLYCIGIYRCYKRVFKEQSKPDIIHAHVLLRSYIVAYLLHLWLHKPYVITEHWSGYHYGAYQRKNKIYKALLKSTMKKAEKVLIVSNRLKKDIIQCVRINETSMEVVPNVAEYATDSKHNKSDRVIKILTVADLKDNIKRVSKVIEILKQPLNKNIEYHIVGDGPDINALKKQASGNLNKKIFFHGELANEEVLKIMPGFDFLIQNSLYETFGLVPLEAILSGLPVISTITGCPDEIQRKEAGIFIDPQKPEELRSAIVRMMDTYETYDLSTVQNLIKQSFSFEKVGEKQEMIYNDILNQ